MSRQPVAAVVGLGINNQPLLPFLQEHGYKVVVADKKPAEELARLIAERHLGEPQALYAGPDYLDRLAQAEHPDVVYLTPGMKKTLAPIEALRAQGARITCETDLFLAHCPAPVIGITGSAGKTTTTTLVGEALKTDGRHPVFVGGNIGRSLLGDLAQITPQSWVVMELSSFQLELVEHSPHGAAFLNLSPNHLDIHESMQAYGAAKSHIFRFQGPDGWTVVPYHDPAVTPLLTQYAGQLVFFAFQDHQQTGSFIDNDTIMYRDVHGQVQPIVAVDQVRLPGAHNVLNVLAAVATVKMAGGDSQALADTIAGFSGVPHRLEKVREHDNILYINDSIATAPDRTMAALKALSSPLVLIAGGYDKHLDYDALGQAIAHSTVHHVVVLGQTQEKIAQAVARYSTIAVIRAATFDDAIREARRVAKPGDTVLLSPASASYDMFNNFEERGRRFREIVESL
ncbi:MAG: UDP-N-acetylmuramoyl-L-alanine--D-glutamate ligase [Sulfobacillus thermotolerans]|uniref:UDP-N-acetylmuramoylalanine--D-glutamate ligase n=1 Tax=Sulfobacillus thermotolerans TaxID=338644 RepID=A0ABN5H173_9FIRM|nr:UDP-N-acetylmuramoyl-L-alanine--D-glutamate ligase [Sulfobacillus thermotolerans]MCY0908328.1 UDP-N-acetylmuramoyl-L-alanine--D-glutamate ligase [Sulfobacillus thermotolerans]